MVIAVGVALTAVSIPFAVASIPSAPAGFWILTALALADAVRPTRRPAAARGWATFSLSVSFCFALLLLYGEDVAIVVLVAAVALAARRLRLTWAAVAFPAARLVWSLAAAGLATRLLAVTGDVPGPFTDGRVGAVVLIALAFLATSTTITLVHAVWQGTRLSQVAVRLRSEALARGSALALGAAVVLRPTVWTLALLLVPVLGWSQLSRLLADQDRRLEHDPVTGLLSRRGLDLALRGLPRDGAGTDIHCGLIVVQLRGIGYIGRSFGRDAVEHVLVAAAGRLSASARPGDLLGRLSDSQLVVVRRDLSADDAEAHAGRIARQMSTPIDVIDGVPLRLDPVAGAAVAPQHGTVLAQLVPLAETAVFDAAAHHALARVYGPEVSSDVDDRLATLQRFSAALNDPARHDEITLLYQPQVSIATGRISSVEALLRWYDPERGLVATEDLMRTVEPTGVMQQLTLHVLDRVTAQLADWNRQGVRLRAAVNVSVLDLCADGFDARVLDILRRHRVPARQLDVEVTERAMVENTALLDEAADRLAKLGVGLSLDDFGTGFASLRRLRRLPLTEVKIDRGYVSRIVDSPSDRALVTAIHDLAGVLGIRTVAEGVEDEATVRLLATFGHVVGQGYYFARPMPAAQVVDWVRDHGGVPDL